MGGDEAEDHRGRDLTLGIGDEDVRQPSLLVWREKRRSVAVVHNAKGNVGLGVAGDSGGAIGVDSTIRARDEFS
jgi:hypothetical protein